MSIAVLLGAAVAAGWAAHNWVDSYRAFHGASDLKIDYVAARIGLTQGWSHIYDLERQAALWSRLGDGFSQLAQPDRSFLSPPLLAWIVAPLTLLPVPEAYLVWSAVVFACLLAAGLLLAPGGWTWRVSQVLLATAAWPVYLGLLLGQAMLIVLVAVAGCWWLLRRGRAGAAGLVLAFTWVKPNLVFLVPLALLLIGPRRAFLTWLAAGVALAALAYLVVGPQGLNQYLTELRAFSGRPFNTDATLQAVVGSGAFLLGVRLALAALTLGIVWSARHGGVEIPLAAALIGSLLVSPYLHPYDFSLLLAAAWLILRADPRPWVVALVLLGVPAAVLASVFASALPLAAYATVLLAGLAATSFSASSAGGTPASLAAA